MISANSGTASTYNNQINTIIGSVTDSSELVAQLKAFDDTLQASRCIEAMINFTKATMTTSQEYDLIREAIQTLKQ